MVAITLDAADLRHGIRAVKHAVSKDWARPVLTTMCIEGDADGVRLVAADNYRIAVYDLVGPTDVLETPEAMDIGRRLVPGDTLPGLDALLAKCGENETVTVELGDSTLTVMTAARESLTARLMDGTFPDYRKVVPSMAERQGAIVAFNPRYIADAARVAKAEGAVVEVSFGRAWDPVLFTASGDRYREVIMPTLTGTGYMERKAAENAEMAARRAQDEAVAS
jgi:DNA polymerase III subunit beta